MIDKLIVTNPPIETLLKLAKDEQSVRNPLEDYTEVLLVLSKKGFTGKKIKEWLEDNGAGSYSLSKISKTLSAKKGEEE